MDYTAKRTAPRAHKSYIKFLYGLVLVTCVVIFSVIKAGYDSINANGLRDETVFQTGRHLLQEQEVEVSVT